MKIANMCNTLKSKIHQMLEGIDDELVLNQVMEDVTFYSSKKDIVKNLISEQINELDITLEEADKKETISWDDFKTEMNEWRKK